MMHTRVGKDIAFDLRVICLSSVDVRSHCCMTVRQIFAPRIWRRGFGSVSHALLSRTFCSARVHVSIKFVLIATAVCVH